MDEDSKKECPMCASRNISFSEREKSLICRDCGNVVAGTPVRLELPKEEAVEIVHEKKPILKRPVFKAKKISKKKIAKKKTAKKKAVKKAKKAVKKKAAKPKKKGFLGRLLRKR